MNDGLMYTFYIDTIVVSDSGKWSYQSLYSEWWKWSNVMRAPTNDIDWASDEGRRIETSGKDVYAKQKHKYTQKDHNLCYADFDTISVRPFFFNSNLHAFMVRRKRAAAASGC